jgi:GTP-binding protein EngB required for normal cell division
MSNLARGLRVGTLVVGMAVMMSACAQLSESDRAMLDQARTEAQNAQAAATRADEAAKRAEAAANQAADAASSAQMAMEKQSRMTQQSLRK